MKPKIDDWFVIYTKPNFEKRINEKITEIGAKPYLPLIYKKRQWRNRTIKTQIPLFSSYIFIQVNRLNYSRILNIPGVVKYLTNCGKPSRVSNDEIERIKRIELLNRDYEICRECYFERGDSVAFNEGPFHGLEGEIIERRGKYRFLVRLKSIKESFSVDIGENILEAVG